MIPKKLLTFLEKHHIQYQPLVHKTVFTAFDVAATLKIKLQDVAKVVMVKVEPKLIEEEHAKIQDYALVVLPSHLRVDLQKLKALLKRKKVALVDEKVLYKALKVKMGAIAPFATLHRIPVYMDKGLKKAKHVVVSAGSYTDSLQLASQELVKAGAKFLGSIGKKK